MSLTKAFRPHRKLSATLILALTSLAVSHSASADDPWITVPAGTQYRIIDDGTTKTLPIAATLKGVKPADARFGIIAVRLDNVFLPELIPAFRVPESFSSVNAGTPLIQLEVDTQQAARFGNYEVWIEARAVAPADQRAEVLKIVIEHPTAVLRPPPTIPIEIIRRGLNRQDVEAKSLELELTSDVSRLSSPVLGAIRYPPATQAFSGRIELAQALSDLKPREKLERGWTVTGEFPLGVIEADTEIRGPQLKDPVAFKLSIKTRRTFLCLWLAAAGGLLLGWISKVLLEGYLQLQRARLEGIRALDTILAQLREAKDPWLETEVSQTIKALQAACAARDAAAITTAATAAQQALATALPKLQTLRKELKDKIDAWLAALAPERDLPSALKGICAEVTDALHGAGRTLKENVAAAEAALAQLQRSARSRLQEEAMRWQESVGRDLKDLADPARLPLPRNVAAQASADTAEVLKDVEALKPAPADASEAQVLLAEIERIRRQLLIGAIEPLAASLDGTAKRVLATLADSLKPDSEARKAFVAALDAALKGLSQGSTEERLRALRPGESADLQALDEAFRKILAPTNVPEPDKTTIEGLLTTRDYESAAQKLADALKPKAKDEKLDRRTAAASTGAEKREEESAIERRGRVATRHGVRFDPTQLDPTTAAEQVQMSETRTRNQIWLAQFVQTLIIGVLFVVIAHLTYADKYIGTFAELAAIFFWAFSLDVTVAKLAEAAKSAGTRPVTK